jgi:nitrite reductase/ring-hydroxylating ferredoxin subunit
MGFVRVASASELSPGAVVEARVGEVCYAVCNFNGEIHALEGSCPCTGGPLGKGALREGLLVCPWHGWRFYPATGVSFYDAAIRIARYPAKVDGGDVFIDVPASNAT